MTGIEYLLKVSNVEKIDTGMVGVIQKKYGQELPEIVKKIVSYGKDTVFLENDLRVLSASEIIQAEEDLHVNFSEKQFLPVADCGENNFIVYHFADNSWSKFNINDESVFKTRKTLDELFK